jgi:peptidoglycan/LPS O-acetylase OafA/YrhL
MKPPPSNVWPVLAFTRFFLALIVAGTHLGPYTNLGDLSYTVLRSFSPSIAVLGFFVISGFSIAASLQQERTGFYGRRALRILPLYFLALVFGAICLLPFGGKIEPQWINDLQPTLARSAGNAAFLQGFACERMLTNGVVWTLSIEVFFYLCAPFLAKLTSVALAGIVGASCTLFVASTFFEAPLFSDMMYGRAVPFLAWSWIAGFLIYRMSNRPLAGLVVLSLLMVAGSVDPSIFTYEWIVTAGIVAAAIAFGDRVKGSFTSMKVLSKMGDASYPLYLFHSPLYIVIFASIGRTAGIVMLVAAITLGFALDALFDRPIKSFFVRRRIRREGDALLAASTASS